MADYYLDATGGLDTNAGTSTGEAWKTIAKLNAATLSAGDRVYFKRGEKWRETIQIPSSGTATAPIKIDAYSTGADPIIDGSEIMSDYVQISGDGHVAKDDYSTGALAAWWSSSANSLVDTWANLGIAAPTGAGTNGLKLDSTGVTAAYAKKDFAGGLNAIWIEGDFLSPASGGNRILLLTIRDTDGTAVASLRYENATSALRFYNYLTSFGITASSPSGNSTWRKVKMFVMFDVYGDGTKGKVEVWQDGVSVISATTGDGVSLGTKKIGSVTVQHSTSTAQAEPLYCGPVRYALYPFDVGAGLYTQTMPNALPADVDAAPPRIFVDGVRSDLAEAAVGDVDATGEWAYDATYHQIYWFDDPGASEYEIPVRQRALDWANLAGTVNSYVHVKNLELRRTVASAVRTVGSSLSGKTCIGSKISKCNIRQSLYSGIAIQYDTQNFDVSGCLISECGHAGIFMNLANADSLVPTDIFICDNYIHDCGRQGITLELVKNCEISRNLIHSIVTHQTFAHGIELKGSNPGPKGTVRIQNNTVYGCEVAAFGVGNSDTGLIKVIARNNIFVATGSGKALIVLSGTGRWDFDYNCFWHETAGNVMITDGSDYTRTQFAAYQSAKGRESNGLCVDPLFVSASDDDFRLTSGSQCKNGGMGVAFTYAKSMGAIEPITRFFRR